MNLPELIRVSDDVSVYDGVLRAYSDALSQGWDAQTCIDRGVCYLIANYASSGSAGLPGWCYLDVDGNGARELLIGEGNLLLAMYTQENGSARLLFTGAERNSYHLEKDMLIVARGSNSAFNSSLTLWYLRNTSLYFKGAIVCDYSVNPNEPWFYSYRDDLSLTGADKVSNKTAKVWMDAYEGNYYLPAFTSFMR